MLILQILFIGWLLFVYFTVWRAIKNQQAFYCHGLLVQVAIEYVEGKRFSTQFIWLIFLFGPLFAIVTYIIILLVIIFMFLAFIYERFTEKISKTTKA